MTLVWYDKEEEEIFLSPYMDAMFCALVFINWEGFEIIGEL